MYSENKTKQNNLTKQIRTMPLLGLFLVTFYVSAFTNSPPMSFISSIQVPARCLSTTQHLNTDFCQSAAEAVKDIPDDSTLLVGGIL